MDSDEFVSRKPTITKKDVLCLHLGANAIGDYYDIQPLCSLARSKLEVAVEEDWVPDNLLHLLTQACTTRKTGDVAFHRLLGQIMARHLEDLGDLARLQDLHGIDMPSVLFTSIFVFSMERFRPLEQITQSLKLQVRSLELQVRLREQEIRHQSNVIESLKKSNSQLKEHLKN